MTTYTAATSCTAARRPCGGRSGGRFRSFIGYVIEVVGYCIVGVVLFGFVIVYDRVGADVGNGFVVFIDGGILGVDVG